MYSFTPCRQRCQVECVGVLSALRAQCLSYHGALFLYAWAGERMPKISKSVHALAHHSCRCVYFASSIMLSLISCRTDPFGGCYKPVA